MAILKYSWVSERGVFILQTRWFSLARHLRVRYSLKLPSMEWKLRFIWKSKCFSLTSSVGRAAGFYGEGLCLHGFEPSSGSLTMSLCTIHRSSPGPSPWDLKWRRVVPSDLCWGNWKTLDISEWIELVPDSQPYILHDSCGIRQP